MRPDDRMNELPAFARELADKYFTSTVSQFILHGAVRDLVRHGEGEGAEYLTLEDYLEKALFARRDAVLFFDRSRGLTIPNADHMKDFTGFLRAYDSYSGTQYHKRLPSDAPSVLPIVERYIRTRVADGKGVAFVIDYAEQIAPAGEPANLSDADRSALVTLRRWSRDPVFMRGDITVVLITEQLAELNRHLVANPFTNLIEIELPDAAERLRFIRWETKGRGFDTVSEIADETFAALTSGLSFTHIRQVLAESLRLDRRIGMSSLMARKKEMIEAECHGLLEFIEPKYNLDMVAGCTEAKARLRAAAKMLASGRLDVLPMGWLVCGPIGTGKTFLASCFTGEIGIPCVKILNIRSQWLGQTEANLQKLLTVFKALGPLGVIIDEADAFFGRRDSSGDSGTQSRVFSSFASFMSDTSHRGRILWFLLTARPDLLPVDLKRQGRAEEHVALFAPASPQERAEFFDVLVKKNGIATDVSPGDFENLYAKAGTPRLSGADLEAVTIRAKGRAAERGAAKVSHEDFAEAFADFLPPVYAEEVEYQTLLAVLECTSRKLIPEPYRSMPRADVSRRVRELKAILGLGFDG